MKLGLGGGAGRAAGRERRWWGGVSTGPGMTGWGGEAGEEGRRSGAEAGATRVVGPGRSGATLQWSVAEPDERAEPPVGWGVRGLSDLVAALGRPPGPEEVTAFLVAEANQAVALLDEGRVGIESGAYWLGRLHALRRVYRYQRGELT